MIGEVYPQAFNRLIKTSSLTDQKVRRYLKPHGITPLQYHILGSLAESYPFPKSPKDIKNELKISSPDVTRILDRLAIKGWVNRKTCEHNRRKVDISINTEGKKKYEMMDTGLKKEINAYLSSKLSGEEIRHLISIISKIDQTDLTNKHYNKNGKNE